MRSRLVIAWATFIYLVVGALLALPVLFMLDGFLSRPRPEEQLLAVIVIAVFFGSYAGCNPSRVACAEPDTISRITPR